VVTDLDLENIFFVVKVKNFHHVDDN